MLLSKITYLEVVNLPWKCLTQRRTIRGHLESGFWGYGGLHEVPAFNKKS